MKFKDIFLASGLLLSSVSLAQEPLHFEVYSQGEGRFSPRLNNSSLKVNSNEVDFSFLFGLYSMNFKKVDDSTYIESVDNNFPFFSKEEIFKYHFKDGHYVFIDYSADNSPRKEKEALEGSVFNKKYKSFPEAFDDFETGNIKDSIHFFVLGLPYSIKVERTQKGKEIIYSSNLQDFVKVEPGDDIIFPYPIEVFGVMGNGKITPTKFSTSFLRAKNGKRTHLEGILKKD